ncbi:MAG: prepilin peptidase [Parcubacteria group bacterium]|nr:prepilin peptidase [Parcubacteria group bacterium]|tara:strand:- start:10209 stop:10958 length:750 start_codon:yes stop_codon:yes gene_type:complete
MIFLIIFLFGLASGSFLNVVILRLGTKKSFLGGRSHCPNCKKIISWYDNIPVLSFLILKARCRQCDKKISWQYLVIEIATALIFVLLYFNFGLSFKFFSYVVFVSFLIIIFVYDLKHYLILDKVSLPAMVVAFVANLILGLSLFNLIIGALIGGGFFAAQYFISKGKWVGGGDIRLGILMGLILGWQLLLVALFLAYLIGAIFGLSLIALNKKKMSSQVPFGPFLTVATLVSLIYGQVILNWYLRLLYV